MSCEIPARISQLRWPRSRAQIHAGLDAIGELPAVPIHGDLKPAHLLFEEERVVLLDLDKFAAGEPMLDVTSMLMPLRRERKTRLAGTSLARVFAEEYFAHVPAAWEQRLAPHYAWAILSEATAFAVSPGKGQAGAKNSRPERREQRVECPRRRSESHAGRSHVTADRGFERRRNRVTIRLHEFGIRFEPR